LLQETKPSPLALLAATCSKIGTGAETLTGSEAVIGQQGSPLRAVVGSNQVIFQVGSDFLGQQSIQLQSLPVVSAAQFVDLSQSMASSAVKQQTMSVVNGTTLSYNTNPLLQMSPQMIATPVVGPGGTIAYNIIPQSSLVMVDGQQDQQAMVLQQQVNAQMTANKQMAQAAQMSSMAAKSMAMTGVRNASLSGGTVSIGSMGQAGMINVGSNANMVATAIRPTNFVQTASQPTQQMVSVQIPVSVGHGQTVYQTIQVPIPSQATNSNSPVTMFNLFPQQTITLAAPQGGSVQCDAQMQGGNMAAGQIITGQVNNGCDVSGGVKYITVQPHQLQQQTQQVYSIGTQGINSNANMSQVAMVIGGGQSGANTNTGGGAIQNFILPNGQVLQTLNGNVCQNVQVVGHNGQVVSGNWNGQPSALQVCFIHLH